MAIKKGSLVRQVMPAPIEGMVGGFKADDETGEVNVLVEWVDADGEEHSRYFKASDLEEVPEPEPEQPAE